MKNDLSHKQYTDNNKKYIFNVAKLVLDGKADIIAACYNIYNKWFAAGFLEDNNYRFLSHLDDEIEYFKPHLRDINNENYNKILENPLEEKEFIKFYFYDIQLVCQNILHLKKIINDELLGEEISFIHTEKSKKIQKILFEIWNPLKLKEISDCSANYDKYVRSIENLLEEKNSFINIFDYLLEKEINDLKTNADVDRLYMVTDALRKNFNFDADDRLI